MGDALAFRVFAVAWMLLGFVGLCVIMFMLVKNWPQAKLAQDRLAFFDRVFNGRSDLALAVVLVWLVVTAVSASVAG